MKSYLSRMLKEMQETQKETQHQLTQLQQDVSAGQAEATKKVVQKLEEEKSAFFKKKGNERGSATEQNGI